MVVVLTSGLALAGYGDAIDGVPSAAEREVHAWTNAVRVEPEAFADAYPCDFESFEASEKTPKPPVLWHDGLGAAARLHSDDMEATGTFSHNSSDGTPFAVRVKPYYPSPTVGENIAMGYASPYDAVVLGWMCSPGHRANIMLESWEELGTGVTGTYYTQDFGTRGVSVLGRPLAMGAHSPPHPAADVTYMASFHHTDPPQAVEVVVNGAAHPLALTWGVEEMGTWTVDLKPNPGCNAYFFRATLADGGTTRFPAGGSYGFGECDFDDPEAGWFAGAGPGAPPEFPDLVPDTGAGEHWGVGDGGDDPERREWRRGCDHGGLLPGWAALGLLALLARRRR